MNDDIAIKVEGLGKKYIIKHEKKEPYSTFQGLLIQTTKKVLNTLNPFHKKDPNDKSTEEFWALNGLNFEIKKGDKVGIIGRNGAGKSTLLKVLSRITEPTKGKVYINGRIASLLEVGTGFHPELTGRENIFLNGAILGMSRKEIKRKFDEIVEFAEVSKFLDTPVKRYSSGMYVRLAFSVAAHLESDILIIDEVLAVGDVEFQKKCMGKMDEVSKAGRTVLFVSHNIGAIQQLCNKGILINTGRLLYAGELQATLKEYQKNAKHNLTFNEQIITIQKNTKNDPVLSLINISLMQGKMKVSNEINNGDPLEIGINYEVKKETVGLRIYIDILDQNNDIIIRSFHDQNSLKIPKTTKGTYKTKTIVPQDLFGKASYFLSIHATIYNQRNIFSFTTPLTIHNTSLFNKGYSNDTFRGKINIALPWETNTY